MIVFRHADSRFPFLHETSAQRPARWHGPGEGPAHYFSESADGAWAEFLRHEGISDPADLAGVARSIWAIDLSRPPGGAPNLRPSILMGGTASYSACREEARRMRSRGSRGLVAPSAALVPGSASGFRVDNGLQPGPSRGERVFVMFGRRPDLVGWAACHEGRPRADLLPRVRPL